MGLLLRMGVTGMQPDARVGTVDESAMSVQANMTQLIESLTGALFSSGSFGGFLDLYAIDICLA